MEAPALPPAESVAVRALGRERARLTARAGAAKIRRPPAGRTAPSPDPPDDAARPLLRRRSASASTREIRLEAPFSRAARAARHAAATARAVRIHRRFRDLTMVPRGSYVRNLLLAERVRSVAGAVVECGVWRGGMIGGIAALLGPGREYWLFDSFEGLPPAGDVDGEAARAWQADTASPGYHDNCRAEESWAREAMRRAGSPPHRLVRGFFQDTLPGAEPPAGGIALLRLDADWYESTTSCLTHLFPHVVDGGLIVLDDYHVWDGCTRAVHDYLSARSSTARIDRFADDVCFLVKRPGA